MKFCCSICLDLLKHPVTVPCGHNYCMKCIKGFWKEDESHSCPQCRQTFTPRPALVKNTMLAELVEELKKAGLDPSAAHSCAGPEDVACNVCTGRKVKALKSCLVCLASYCEQHLQPHYESPAFQKHKLAAASFKLQETICSRHHEVMKIFCRTDQQCICYLCSMDQHKGHDTVPAAAERTKKEKELEANLQQVQQRIQHKEEDVRLLQQELEVMNTERICQELVSLIKRICSDVKQQIRTKRKNEVSRLKELQEKLKQDIDALEKRNMELEQLSKPDPTQFLQSYHTQPQPAEAADSSTGAERLEEIAAAMTAARDRLQVVLQTP